MRPLKIAIPAHEGSFHYDAARRYFGSSAEVIHCSSMMDAAERVSRNEADYALLACDNTSAGDFPLTYDVLRVNSLFITDEILLRVNLCLATKEGVHISDVKRIYSHPYALQQVKKYLAGFDTVHAIPVQDTVEAANRVKSSAGNDAACLCSEWVVQEKGLKLLSGEVQDVKLNYTRFLVAGKGTHMHVRHEKMYLAWNGNGKEVREQLLSILKDECAVVRWILSDQWRYLQIESEPDGIERLMHRLRSLPVSVLGYSRSREQQERIVHPIAISL